MISVPLSSTYRCKNFGRYVTILDDVDGDLALLAWQAKVVRVGKTMTIYAFREERRDGTRKKVFLHRVVFERANGTVPADMEIDHIEPGDFGGLDNRRCNLRLATHTQNAANGRLRANNSSGFKGVHFVRRTGRWQALIRVEGRRRHLGYFSTSLEAALAYDAAAVDAWRAFARPNTALA
jgi:hypothetical protein